jgi:hypothetical protein
MTKGPFTHFITLAGCLIGASSLLLSCRKETSQGAAPNTSVRIAFKATVDGDELVYGKIYKNPFGEDFSVKTFRFYIHGVELENTQTNVISRLDKNDHYLITTSFPSTHSIQILLTPGVYDRINFIIGVDSIRNVSGAQTGALDPAQGMFWTWSTGYIMAKLEGNSAVAATPNNVIEYHIGGFKGTESAIRKVSLNFPVQQKLELRHGVQGSINISANINRWFNGGHEIRISDKAVSMTPGTLAKQIADNYSNMFTVVQIVNE